MSINCKIGLFVIIMHKDLRCLLGKACVGHLNDISVKVKLVVGP